MGKWLFLLAALACLAPTCATVQEGRAAHWFGATAVFPTLTAAIHYGDTYKCLEEAGFQPEMFPFDSISWMMADSIKWEDTGERLAGITFFDPDYPGRRIIMLTRTHANQVRVVRHEFVHILAAEAEEGGEAFRRCSVPR